ncbi:MAG: DegT/DnrJ/EryC1/StrS family aminotransferase [Deltaproteobacteria bacterium]|jgi:dTDP-4-amino-4,6-dideoxygalactose transaminase|nr:DegT/DnrJ/EryC1/StrS family aminotransferase [Deltaproteobacteria bacterium]
MEVPLLKIPITEPEAARLGEEFRDLLLSGRLAMGGRCRRFEEAFAAFAGTRTALGCPSGTAALELIFRALDVRGKSVLVPGLTFMATALAAAAAGAKIILADVESRTFQLDPAEVREKIQPGTAAAVLVHLGGFISGQWTEIKSLADANGSCLVEDAAHAAGAKDGSAAAGSLGRAAAFSFYPTKVLTTAEGGMVTTDDEELARKMAVLRQHGQEKPGSNIHEHFGLNFRPSEIHALLGLLMMEKADWILAERRKAAAVYDRLFSNTPVAAVRPPAGNQPAYYKYMALLPEKVCRSKLKQRLKDEYQVSLAGEVYTTPLNRQPFFIQNPGVLAAPLTALPVSEMISQRQICLPIWPGLSLEAQEYAADCLLKCL